MEDRNLMDTDLVGRRGYYKVLKITDSHDCDYGPCKIYTISNGTDEPVEIGLYLNVPTDNPSGLLENPLDGTPRISIDWICECVELDWSPIPNPSCPIHGSGCDS